MHKKNYSAQTYKKPKLTKIQIQHRNSSPAHCTTSRKKKHSIHLNYILYIVTAEQQQTRTDMQLPGQLYPKCD